MSRKRARDRAARETMDRAIRRLGVLEWLLLALAAGAALLAGALTGWLLGQAFGWPFRWSWAVSSLLYFIGPGGLAWWKTRRDAVPRTTRTKEGRHDG